MSEVVWPVKVGSDVVLSTAVVAAADYLNDLNERLAKLERDAWWGKSDERG